VQDLYCSQRPSFRAFRAQCLSLGFKLGSLDAPTGYCYAHLPMGCCQAFMHSLRPRSSWYPSRWATLSGLAGRVFVDRPGISQSTFTQADAAVTQSLSSVRKGLKARSSNAVFIEWFSPSSPSTASMSLGLPWSSFLFSPRILCPQVTSIWAAGIGAGRRCCSARSSGGPELTLSVLGPEPDTELGSVRVRKGLCRGVAIVDAAASKRSGVRTLTSEILPSTRRV